MAFAVWPRIAAKMGTARAWGLAAGINATVFLGCIFLSADTPHVALWFGLVCVGTGFSLGADLILPQALIAARLQKLEASHRATAVFGLWIFAQKSALALAAGVGLLILDISGTHLATALLLLYCVIPCGLKLIAARMAWKI